MRLTPRKRLVVDPKVQGSLVVRVFGYWCFFLIIIGQVLLASKIPTAPPGPSFGYLHFVQVLKDHATVIAASLVMLPIMIMDVLYVSNRFLGPIYRARRSLRSLAAGENVTPLVLRPNDFRRELADEVNAVATYIQYLQLQITMLKSERSFAANGQQHVAMATEAQLSAGIPASN